MTKHEIIDYIVEYYRTHDRSLSNDGTCLYNGPNGVHCAFALMCENPQDLRESYKSNELTGIARMKPEFAGHSVDFYRAIQVLHDVREHWNARELTLFGQKYIAQLKRDYSPLAPRA